MSTDCRAGADLRFFGPQPGTSWSGKTVDTGPVCRTVGLFTPPAYAAVPTYTASKQRQMWVNNLSEAALDSAAAGVEPAISSRKSNALTTAPPSHNPILLLLLLSFSHTTAKTYAHTRRIKISIHTRLHIWDRRKCTEHQQSTIAGK